MKTHPLFVITTFMLVVSSCTTSYYAPSPHSVPLLTEQNEVSASVGRTRFDRTFSTDLQAAYSPAPHLGLMFNASFFEPREGRYSKLRYGMEGSLLEGAIGYYKAMEGSFSMDAYVGYGHLSKGSTAIDFYSAAASDPAFKANFNYNRFFFQPSIGFKDDIVDFVFSLRLSELLYQNVRYDSLPNNNLNLEDFFLLHNTNYTMLEPALTGRLGYKYVKVQAQLGTSYNLSRREFAHDIFSFSIGVIFNFRPSFGKKEASRFGEEN